MLGPFGRGRGGRGRGFYDPFSEVNRMFDEAFGGLAHRSAPRPQLGAAQEWTPAIDVVQDDGDLVVRAELPGARPEDVEITVHNGLLTIGGRVQEEREEQRGGYLVRERRSGSFRRSLQLPEGVDEDNIRARFENGVLEVTLQGAAAVQEPKRIQVEGSSVGSEGGQDIEITGGGGDEGSSSDPRGSGDGQGTGGDESTGGQGSGGGGSSGS